MTLEPSHLVVRLATTEADLLSAQRLRYQVFVRELGGDGPLVDHVAGLERDEFDAVYDHLVLVDPRRDTAALDHVVGVYRLLTGERDLSSSELKITLAFVGALLWFLGLALILLPLGQSYPEPPQP